MNPFEQTVKLILHDIAAIRIIHVIIHLFSNIMSLFVTFIFCVCGPVGDVMGCLLVLCEEPQPESIKRKKSSSLADSRGFHGLIAFWLL